MTNEKKRKKFEGVVVSNKMTKAVVVRVERKVPHPKYKKIITKYTKLYAGNELGSIKEGDVVVVEECRPLSKLIRFKVIEKK
ncbi:MAG: 30S ribosomal protein S17 [Candidatus Dojkabacteria bacterium]|nr:30S ribosomal protein S17 [Candidatus Dojkabacteria bacterium]